MTPASPPTSKTTRGASPARQSPSQLGCMNGRLRVGYSSMVSFGCGAVPGPALHRWHHARHRSRAPACGAAFTKAAASDGEDTAPSAARHAAVLFCAILKCVRLATSNAHNELVSPRKDAACAQTSALRRTPCLEGCCAMRAKVLHTSVTAEPKQVQMTLLTSRGLRRGKRHLPLLLVSHSTLAFATQLCSRRDAAEERQTQCALLDHHCAVDHRSFATTTTRCHT